MWRSYVHKSRCQAEARTHALLIRRPRDTAIGQSKANNSHSSKPTPLSTRPHSHTKVKLLNVQFAIIRCIVDDRVLMLCERAPHKDDGAIPYKARCGIPCCHYGD